MNRIDGLRRDVNINVNNALAFRVKHDSEFAKAKADIEQNVMAIIELLLNERNEWEESSANWQRLYNGEHDRLAAVDAVFSGGPDTSCRTVWDEGTECVSVPLDELRAALGVTVAPTSETMKCPRCDGRGRVNFEEDSCPKCLGIGVVEVVSVTPTPNGEWCLDCGRAYADTPWRADDALFVAVIGSDAGMYCPSCFGVRAAATGFEIEYWVPTPWPVTSSPQDNACPECGKQMIGRPRMCADHGEIGLASPADFPVTSTPEAATVPVRLADLRKVLQLAGDQGWQLDRTISNELDRMGDAVFLAAAVTPEAATEATEKECPDFHFQAHGPHIWNNGHHVCYGWPRNTTLTPSRPATELQRATEQQQ